MKLSVYPLVYSTLCVSLYDSVIVIDWMMVPYPAMIPPGCALHVLRLLCG